MFSFTFWSIQEASSGLTSGRYSGNRCMDSLSSFSSDAPRLPARGVCDGVSFVGCFGLGVFVVSLVFSFCLTKKYLDGSAV